MSIVINSQNDGLSSVVRRRVLAILAERKISQADLARLMLVSPQALHKMLHGDPSVKLSVEGGKK